MVFGLQEKKSVVVLAFAILLLVSCGAAPQAEPVQQGMPVPGAEPEPEMVVEETVSGTEPTVKTFVLTGSNFKFVMGSTVNPDLVVQQGDNVRIEFSATDGFHDWKADEFNAATEKVKPGTSTFVEFTADKKGTFEYYCSVGSHRQEGMKGKLIVE